ncbi:amidohydrolase family protein [Aeromonas allosaccharophila]|nr:amidohydrolase family protein [Aeromonas allosaccharophila]WDO03981.1 amidohydrolase family protein [Aeromonas allosaccharophila]
MAAVRATQLGVSLERALAAVTSNPAQVLGLGSKGRIGGGQDADLLLVHARTFAIERVMSGGQWRG